MIILDEPTNHLDIDSRAALAEAINEFPGAVIMVSHDRYLIEACADRLWVVADHAVTNFDGDLDDYRRLVLSARGKRAAGAREQRAQRPAATEANARRGEKQKPLKQKISEAEAEIERITAHHRQDRHRARATGYLHPRSEAGGAAQPGPRQCSKRAAARRGAMAGSERAE